VTAHVADGRVDLVVHHEGGCGE